MWKERMRQSLRGNKAELASWVKGEGQGPASYLIQPSDGANVADVERMHDLLAKTWKGIFCML
eukprot:11234679-Alexandrium_andersonii.AAC.1